jgi:hypothetical protein
LCVYKKCRTFARPNRLFFFYLITLKQTQMKKFLLSLAVLFAGLASAQTYYQAGDEVDEVWEGESFLLSPDKSGARFLTNDGSKYLTDQIPTDDALVEFEEAGEDEAGNILYYIKFSNAGLYLADWEIWDGKDSSDMVNWELPYMTLTDDTEKAAKWTVLPAETRYKAEKGAEDYVANWRVWTGQGTGQDTEESKGNLKVHAGAFVIMRDKLSTSNPNELTEGGMNPVYLEVQGDYTFFASWGANSWFISFPEEMDSDMLLEAWVASVLGDFDVESVYENEIYLEFLDNENGSEFITARANKVALEQEDWYYTSPAFVGSSEARDQVGTLLDAAIQGTMTVDEAFRVALQNLRAQ